jgi:glutaredoxin domain-containing cysteine-rich protein 1
LWRKTKKEIMGCASSKRVEATAPAVYQPPPTSFAVFDINAIEEPWLKHLNNTNTTTISHEEKLPPPILHILDATEKSPQSWDEVSKTLQHLKPTVQVQPPPPPSPPQTPPPSQQSQPQPPRKVASFHTLEELDAKLSPKNNNKDSNSKQKTTKVDDADVDVGVGPVKTLLPSVSSKLKDNIFIKKDRLEKQQGERESNFERLRRDPLSNYPEKIPPNGNDAVVIYTTSLRGVRKTFDNCNKARDLLENHRVIFDERDVALHGEFLKEVKDLLLTEEESGSGVVLPRVFVKGRYLGGLDELMELDETGRLGRILNATRVERGVGRQGCGGCGGLRFVPCYDCGGSCKLVNSVGGVIERCPKCNENGLVHCPACI